MLVKRNQAKCLDYCFQRVSLLGRADGLEGGKVLIDREYLIGHSSGRKRLRGADRQWLQVASGLNSRLGECGVNRRISRISCLEITYQ